MSGFLDWKEARQRVLAGVNVCSQERVALPQAAGRAVAKPVVARVAMPPFDNSAMDGFAVRAADVASASEREPAHLSVVGELAAGSDATSMTVGEGQAVRIMTGAPLPPGADAVVPVEGTQFWDAALSRARRPSDEAEAARVQVFTSVAPGAHVRRAGESAAAGSVVLERGDVIQGPEIGLLASVGYAEVSVYSQPRVGVLSTGDELVDPGSPLPLGSIPDSNRPALLATLTRLGFAAVDCGRAPDDDALLTQAITAALSQVDFLLTSGGVSVGDYDVTRNVLSRMGQVTAYRVAVKPGKPQLFGHLEGVPVFGLPGNPVSSLVVFEQFALPALKKMAGHRSETWFPELFHAVLDEPLRRKPGRVEFLRVRLAARNGVWRAIPTGPQGSGVLTSLTRANGYALLPPEAESLQRGDPVSCQFMA